MLLILYQAFGFFAVVGLLALAPFVPSLRRGLAERLGRAAGGGGGGTVPGRGGETIWVHAASVGEVRAATPLVRELLRRRPGARILISTFTTHGRQIAFQHLAAGEPRVSCRLLPIDWGWLPGRVIRRERPALFILLETELWPVLLTALRRAGVPVLIANGRISPRSFGRYRALRRGMRPLLEAVTLALVRTAGDAARYEAIGMPAERVRIAGNLKHARLTGDNGAAVRRQSAIRLRLGTEAGRPVLVAGSMRGAESDLVLEAFRRLRAALPELLLVLAPRHPERFGQERLAAWAGSWARWSESPQGIERRTAVVLLDTLGELADFYAAAGVACVGGTWVDHGGHNLLEPAHHGVPVVFGPDFSHFDDEGRALLEAGGGFLAQDAAGLSDRCLELFRDPAARATAGRRALEVATAFSGAVEKVAGAAIDLLEGRVPRR
jgi:3-deoxy-D-manno-octulosonic-acid transferase